MFKRASSPYYDRLRSFADTFLGPTRVLAQRVPTLGHPSAQKACGSHPDSMLFFHAGTATPNGNPDRVQLPASCLCGRRAGVRDRRGLDPRW